WAAVERWTKSQQPCGLGTRPRRQRPKLSQRKGPRPIRGSIVRRIAFLFAAATGLAAHTDRALADAGPCQSMQHDRSAYAICEVDLRRPTVRLYWNRPDGTPFGYLSALPRDLEGGAGRLLFATNAGMFDSKLKPVGLYVERGRELVHANTKSGKGN